MRSPEATTWFAGDLDDPWVAAIAEALPPGTVRIPCAGDLPETWPGGRPPAVLVLHRPLLTGLDAERLRRLRGRGDRPPRVVVCVGPHARAHQLERWSPLVDAILPEATARETIARHVGTGARASVPRPAVAVVSSQYELRWTLADACRDAGYQAELARSWPEAVPAPLAVWDVPVLEPGWPVLLEAQAATRCVVALLGFADRETVALARARGAAACLDLPCDPADLAFVLDRLAQRLARPGARRRAEPAHGLPPAPASSRRVGGAVRGS
jgi:hypothetical protein